MREKSTENEPEGFQKDQCTKVARQEYFSIFWLLFHFLIIGREEVDTSAINWRLAGCTSLQAKFPQDFFFSFFAFIT